MTGYFQNLIDEAAGIAASIQPRARSRFEPSAGVEMPEPQPQVDNAPSNEFVRTKGATSNPKDAAQIKQAITSMEPLETRSEKSNVAEPKQTRVENELQGGRPIFEQASDGHHSGQLDSLEQFRQANQPGGRPLPSVQDSQSLGPIHSPSSNADQNDQLLISSVVAQTTTPNTVQIGESQTENDIDQQLKPGILDSLKHELNQPPTIRHDQVIGANVQETSNAIAIEQGIARTAKPSEIEEKQINVHIGRIEIKAIKQPAAQKRTKAKRSAIGGLDDYLKLNSERSRQ